MISLDEQTQAPSLKTSGELHRSLMDFLGRLVRIRQHRIDFDPYMGGFYEDDDDYGRGPSWSVDSSDSLGRLQGLQLQDHNTIERSDPMPELTDGSLIVKLEGLKSFQIELQRSLVEALQEDSGRWIPIHRGSGYPQEAATVEEAA